MNKKTIKVVRTLSIVSMVVFVFYCVMEALLLALAIAERYNKNIGSFIGNFDALRFFVEQISVIAILFCLNKVFVIIKREEKFFVYPVNLWVRGMAVIALLAATFSNVIYKLLFGMFNSGLKLSFVIKINFTGVIIGIALLILSLAIEHGIKLQKQDDEII